MDFGSIFFFSLSLSLRRAVRSSALCVRVTALSLSSTKEKKRKTKKREKKKAEEKNGTLSVKRENFPLFCVPTSILLVPSPPPPPKRKKGKIDDDDDDDEEEEEEKVASLHFSEREREREREEKRSRKWRSVSFLRALNAVLFGNTFTNEQNVQFAV